MNKLEILKALEELKVQTKEIYDDQLKLYKESRDLLTIGSELNISPNILDLHRQMNCNTEKDLVRSSIELSLIEKSIYMIKSLPDNIHYNYGITDGYSVVISIDNEKLSNKIKDEVQDLKNTIGIKSEFDVDAILESVKSFEEEEDDDSDIINELQEAVLDKVKEKDENLADMLSTADANELDEISNIMMGQRIMGHIKGEMQMGKCDDCKSTQCPAHKENELHKDVINIINNPGEKSFESLRKVAKYIANDLNNINDGLDTDGDIELELPFSDSLLNPKSLVSEKRLDMARKFNEMYKEDY